MLSPPNHARGSVEWGSGALATRLLEGGGVLPGLEVWGRRPRVSQGVHRALLVATRVCVEFWGAKAGQALLVCAAARVLLVCAAAQVLKIRGGELVNRLTEPVYCPTELIDRALAQSEILEKPWDAGHSMPREGLVHNPQSLQPGQGKECALHVCDHIEEQGSLSLEASLSVVS